jgi:D-glycero-D-manno-heptose 1,7-bisphosphate phosphatase
MVQRRKAIFLDRDGTIIDDVGFIQETAQVVFYPYTFDALRMLQKSFMLFIVTNQSGVGLGTIPRDVADRINDFVVQSLQTEGVTITRLYCCSHKRDDHCSCIKPKPFFLEQAVKDYNVDLAHSFTIGDHPHDVEFGNNNGATGLYVMTGHGRKHYSDLPEGTVCFDTLLKAAQWIDKSQ